MKSSKIARIAAVALLAAAASAAFADTLTMDVKAQVTGTCKMVAANALDFGTLDPVAAPAVPGKTTTIQYLCTKGKTPQSLTIDTNGSGSYLGNMAHTSGDKIPFDLSWSTALPAGKGMGSGNEVSVTVTGNIAAGVYQNVTAGNYLVQLPVTLTP